MTAVTFITFATAVIISAAGFLAITGYGMRPGRRERLLLWFGVFAAIYGVRMFFKQPLAATVGISDTTADWVDGTLDFVILIPALLFAEGLYGRGWRGSFRWLIVAIGGYGVIAAAINVVTREPHGVPEPSLGLLALVLVVVVVGARAGYRPPPFPEWRLLLAAIVIFLLFVVNEHASNAGVVPWRHGIEPIGFLIQLACLGYIAVSRFFAQGRQLAAVDQEMRSAREIQTSILPRELPRIPGVRIAARYLPLAAVAGDFYDVVAGRNGDVAVLVADVSGHGVPAALIASMVKVAFTTALNDTRDPGALLTRMNGALCGMFARSYVTAACLVVRPDSRTLAYALAGHPPPLLLGDNGDPVALDERGIFLGFTADASYTTTTIPLAGQTRIVLYTDGVTETPAAGGDLFGVERLSAQMTGHRSGTPASFADDLVGALHRFAGLAHNGARSKDSADNGAGSADNSARIAFPHDDVTLVVMDVAILNA